MIGKPTALVLLFVLPLGLGLSVHADTRDAERAYQSGQYFSAARIAFNEVQALQSTGSAALKAQHYFWVMKSLVKAGLDQSAFYFFVRTLEMKDRPTSRLALDFASFFTERMGPDLMRSILMTYTQIQDYSASSKNAYLLVLAKEKLLKGDFAAAIQAVDSMNRAQALYPVGLQIRGTANALLKRAAASLQDFADCGAAASQRFLDRDLQAENVSALDRKWVELKRQAAKDLTSRCIAGQARILYELEQFEEADRAYDDIPKASMVWPDTLFEHAWNSYAKQEYNRTLGKLVSYKSPALRFMFNTEIDVLMAQTYAALCLYDDASKVIEYFNREYSSVAKEIKGFVMANATSLDPYFRIGKQAVQDKLHSDRDLHRFLNRFVRSPNFQSLVLAEERALSEKVAITRMDSSRMNTRTGTDRGFPGFLNQILDWRIRTNRQLGGAFVKNSILDYHQVLISDFEKIQFLKIDILSHQKEQLMAEGDATPLDRKRGNRRPVRRDDQMLWSFNGEFWNDEIGDYVFALDSECKK